MEPDESVASHATGATAHKHNTRHSPGRNTEATPSIERVETSILEVIAIIEKAPSKAEWWTTLSTRLLAVLEPALASATALAQKHQHGSTSGVQEASSQSIPYAVHDDDAPGPTSPNLSFQSAFCPPPLTVHDVERAVARALPDILKSTLALELKEILDRLPTGKDDTGSDARWPRASHCCSSSQHQPLPPQPQPHLTERDVFVSLANVPPTDAAHALSELEVKVLVDSKLACTAPNGSSAAAVHGVKKLANGTLRIRTTLMDIRDTLIKTPDSWLPALGTGAQLARERFAVEVRAVPVTFRPDEACAIQSVYQANADVLPAATSIVSMRWLRDLVHDKATSSLVIELDSLEAASNAFYFGIAIIVEPSARSIFTRQLVAGFVDDTALVVSSKEGAERNIELLLPLVQAAFGWSETHACQFDPSKFHLVHHTRNKARDVSACLVIGGITIKPETVARYLGILLDKELRWHAQVDHAVAKGTAAALAIGRLASGRFGLPYRFIRTLYIAVVRPRLQYGLALWYTPVQSVPGETRRRGSVGFATRLGRVQRIAARLITGAFRTAPTDALEYHADLMPMDIQLNIAAFASAVRLATLPFNHPLAPSVQRCRARVPRYFRSPIHKTFLAFPSIGRVETVDPTPRATTWSSPIVTSIATSREAAAAEVRDLELDAATFMIFTDGSGEGGQVGAAAVAAHPCSGEVIARRAHLGTLCEHTVFEAELFGVLMGLRLVLGIPGVLNVAICLDNQSAIVRARCPRPKSGQLITEAIHDAVEKLRATRPGFELRLVWVPGHEGVAGNELADLHAKDAAADKDAELARIDDEPLPDSAAALNAAYKQSARVEWQARWASSPRGLRYARFDRTPPSPKVARIYQGLKRAEAALLTQLRTGHVALNHYLHRFGAVNSPLCTHCSEPETVDHYLIRCSRFLAPRQALRGQLQGQILSAKTLLGMRKNRSALMAFIHRTGRLALKGQSRPSSSSASPSQT